MKNHNLRILTFSIIALLLGSSVFAQTKDNKWAVGLHGNLNAYQGDLGNGFFDFDQMKNDAGAGLSLGYYLSPSFDVSIKGTYFNIDYKDKDGTYSGKTGGYADGKTPFGNWMFDSRTYTGTANLKFKFNNGWLLKEEAIISPFAIGGVGVMGVKSKITRDVKSTKTTSNLALYYGGGLNFRVSERFNVVLEAGIYNPMTDVYDGIEKRTVTRDDADKSGDQFLQYSLGLTYNFGKKKDADGDGIADRKDKCPDTPAGVAVDENGCPIDTDSDGVADYLDQCPNEAGTVNGCPDADADGIADKDDACPKVAGLKSLNGCPDTDKDGIIDSKDKCADTPEGVKVDKNGCPIDTDGDGVADYLDQCPNEAGVAENNGCPKVEEPVYFDRTVHFRFGKSYINRKNIEILNEVIAKMNEDETLTATISGHTDATGSDSINQRLSERRAKAVKKFIVSKGVKAERINTVGYGEKSPIDTNKTRAGRANNRRAEVRIRLN